MRIAALLVLLFVTFVGPAVTHNVGNGDISVTVTFRFPCVFGVRMMTDILLSLAAVSGSVGTSGSASSVGISAGSVSISGAAGSVGISAVSVGISGSVGTSGSASSVGIWYWVTALPGLALIQLSMT